MPKVRRTGSGVVRERGNSAEGARSWTMFHTLDRNRFDEFGEKCGVIRGEHEDPREQVEDAHWGLGYHSPLTEVVEEDETTEEVSSSGDSDTSSTSSD